MGSGPISWNQVDVHAASDDDEVGDAEAVRRGKKKRRRFRPEAKRDISWIWKLPRATGGTEDDSIIDEAEEASQALKIEWAKTQARAQRFAEEEELVVEEMRRVLSYFAWKANWWRNDAGNGSNERVRRGCAAYAERQAHLIDSLRNKFEEIWKEGVRKLCIDERRLYEPLC
jgi:hypothetical protein